MSKILTALISAFVVSCATTNLNQEAVLANLNGEVFNLTHKLERSEVAYAALEAAIKVFIQDDPRETSGIVYYRERDGRLVRLKGYTTHPKTIIMIVDFSHEWCRLALFKYKATSRQLKLVNSLWHEGGADCSPSRAFLGQGYFWSYNKDPDLSLN